MAAEKKTKSSKDVVPQRKKVQTAEGWKRSMAKIRGEQPKRTKGSKKADK